MGENNCLNHLISSGDIGASKGLDFTIITTFHNKAFACGKIWSLQLLESLGCGHNISGGHFEYEDEAGGQTDQIIFDA